MLGELGSETDGNTYPADQRKIGWEKENICFDWFKICIIISIKVHCIIKLKIFTNLNVCVYVCEVCVFVGEKFEIFYFRVKKILFCFLCEYVRANWMQN